MNSIEAMTGALCLEAFYVRCWNYAIKMLCDSIDVYLPC